MSLALMFMSNCGLIIAEGTFIVQFIMAVVSS